MFNVCPDFRGIELNESVAETLTYKKFRSGHVTGRHRCIGRAFRQACFLSGEIGYVKSVPVALANPTHVTDVMTKQRDDEVEPIARRYAACVIMPTTQDFLADKRNHDCVIYIVVGGAARGDIFKGELGGEADYARVAGLQCT